MSKLSQRRRSSRKPDAAECYMCNANIELETPDSFATCRGCEKLVCRGGNCCQWVESIGIWECTGCQSNRVIQQKAGEWLLNQLTVRLKHPGPVELKDGNLLGLGLDTDDARSTTSSTATTVSANQRVKVREFIEELLSAMLHGPLDDVSVGQLMKHESCPLMILINSLHAQTRFTISRKRCVRLGHNVHVPELECNEFTTVRKHGRSVIIDYFTAPYN
uniref:FYVE-type zinc finger domain-containing protein n=1 Tax=Anopheles coluzzii TaxID=1518534 RepID=A0A8W7P368_ANOCL